MVHFDEGEVIDLEYEEEEQQQPYFGSAEPIQMGRKVYQEDIEAGGGGSQHGTNHRNTLPNHFNGSKVG